MQGDREESGDANEPCMKRKILGKKSLPCAKLPMKLEIYVQNLLSGIML